MFKKLKEKVSTVTTELESARTRIQGMNSQATQFIDHLVNTSSNSSESNGKSEAMGAISSDTATDLLDLNVENPPKSSEKSNESTLDQFSLVELDDDSPTHISSDTASNLLNTSSSHSENDSYFSLKPITSPTNNFVPQSDIESEYESETHSRNYAIESVTKEQLLELCVKLKERGKKYREKWSLVVKEYRRLSDEREKMKKVLSDTQDKALRRINEMKEQCNLEQQAKRHLEENLRVVIEEKDEKIKVLQTKIQLLNSDDINGETNDLLDLHTNEEKESEMKELTDKVDRLETLLTRCKESLKTNKEKLVVLNKENEELLNCREKYEKINGEIDTLKKQREDNSLSFAEAKQKLHEELEARNIIIKELRDQFERKKQEFTNFESDLKAKSDKIRELEDKVIGIEKTTEEDKQNLIQELSRGKSAAIHLIREESEKKLNHLEEEWKQKYETLELQTNELNRLLSESESSNKQMILDDNRKQIEETNRMNEILKNEIKECQTRLDQTIEELNRAQEIRETEKINLEKLLSDSKKKSSELLSEIQTLNERSANLEELKLELQRTESLLRNAEKTTDDARHDLESLRNQLEDKDVLINQMKEENIFCEQEFQNKLDNLQKELTENNIKTENIQKSEESDFNIQLIDIQNEITLQKQKTKELEEQIKGKEEDIRQLKLRNEELETNVKQSERIETDLKQQSDKCLEFQHIINENQQKIQLMTISLSENNENLKQITEELEECKQHLIDANNQLKDRENKFENDLQLKDNAIERLEVELKDLSHKMESYIEERQQLNQQNMIYCDKITEKESINNDIQLQCNALKEELNKLRDESKNGLEILSKLKEEKESEINECKKLIETEQSKNCELLSKIDFLSHENQELNKFKEILENNETENKLIFTKNEELKQIIKEKEISINQLSEDLNCKQESNKLMSNELQKQLELKEKQINDLNNEIKTLNERFATVSQLSESQINENKHLVENLESKLNDSKNLNEIVSNEKNILNNENKNLISLNTNLNERILSLETQLNEEINERKKVLDHTKLGENDLQNMRDDYKSLEGIKNELNQKLTEITNNLELKCNQINELNEIIEKLQNNSDLNSRQLEDQITSTESLKSELNRKNEMISNFEKKIQTNDKLIERLNSTKLEKDLLGSELEKCKQQIIKYQSIESEYKELNKHNEELKLNLAENSIKHTNEMDDIKSKMSQLKEQNELTVEKLYKQLEIRETELDESLMAVESRHNSTTQELLALKSDNSKLKQELEEITSKKQSLENQFQESKQRCNELENERQDNSEEKNDVLIDKINSLESKLHEKEQEFDGKVEKFHENEDKLIFTYKKQISSLETELTEKNSALEEVHEYYQQMLKDKDNELKCLHSEFGSSSVNEHTYQVKAMQNSLLQYQEENVRLKELLNIRRFAETNNSENTPLISGVHLPEPTEYEYLRNILFEFMVGREPVTLAKVIAAVMKFSGDQTDQIIKKQESNQLISLRQFKPI